MVEKENTEELSEEDIFNKLIEWDEDVLKELNEIEEEVTKEEHTFCIDENDNANAKRGILTRAQERFLFNRLKDEDTNEKEKKNIRNYLVFKNIKLVYSIMKKNSFWFDKDDVFEQWIKWVFESIDKFKIEKDFKFSTYAIWYIRKYIQDHAIQFKYWFKVTWHKINEMARIKKLNEEYQQEFWESRSYEELLYRSWMAKKTFDSAYALITTSFKSLDSSMYEWSDWASMHNYLVWWDLWEEMLEKDSIDMIKEITLRVLKPFEKDVFNRLNWFDINNWLMVWEEMEADEIAELYWIDKAEVRKINRAAKEKIQKEIEKMMNEDPRESDADWFNWKYF